MKKIIDGNTACAMVSYKFTEVAGIYPITPSYNLSIPWTLYPQDASRIRYKQLLPMAPSSPLYYCRI